MTADETLVVGQFPRRVREIDNLWITLADGTRLAARVWLPEDARQKPVPAILEYLPYRKRDGTVERDALTHPYLAGHGYACLRVDMRGNGDSDGVMLDEYLVLEQDDAIEVINWIVTQPWCSGQVAMMGISWGGFNALQVAARRPAPLKAIVTVCSTDDRYADDIHYKGGALLLDNLGWAATMFAYSSRPPDPMIVGEQWREMWLQRLEATPLLIDNWLRHPHRDAYWQHGSVCEDYARIEAAVLAVGGWADAYSNAVPRMLAGLTCPRRGIVGPWMHKYPHFAQPAPRIDFLGECLVWLDRWLKGIEPDTTTQPMYCAYMMDSEKPQTAYRHRAGRWVAEDAWPSEKICARDTFLTPGALKSTAHSNEIIRLSSPLSVGVAAGKYCAMRLGPESPGDQRVDDALSVVFDSPALLERKEIFGAPELFVRIRSDTPSAQLAVRLCDVQPSGESTRVSYATFNLCHREGHAAPTALVLGQWYDVRIQLDDIAYSFAPGHKLRLSLSTSYWPLIWPSPVTPCLEIRCGEDSYLRLPERNATGKPEVSFDGPRHAPPMLYETLLEESHSRVVERDLSTGVTSTRIVDDSGVIRIAEHGMEVGECATEVYTIRDDDPLSATAQIAWTTLTAREHWRTRTETKTTLTCDQDYFYIEANLTAFEGEKKVFERSWDKQVRRQLV